MKEQECLNRLRVQIEDLLGWGPGVTWRGKDFENLSESILEKTGEKLSVTTLKRCWGRAARQSNLSATTLDILSQYIGYESWRNYCTQPLHIKKKKVKRKNFIPHIPVTLSILLLISLLYLNPDKPLAIDESNILFTMEKVTSGTPNTVLFRYDIGDLSFDSLSIQQSWDETKQISLQERKGLVTSTYYYPGYYLAKLIVDGQVAKNYELYISTSGWHGIIPTTENQLQYLPKNDIILNNGIKVSAEVLSSMKELGANYLYLANLSEDPQIPSGRFTFSSRFKLSESTEQSICKSIRLVVTGTHNVFNFQFSEIGCVGDLIFALNQEMVYGKNTDLSKFGIDHSDWTDFILEAEDNHIKAYVNEEKALDFEVSTDIGKIGGVQWFFEGTPTIQEMELRTDGKIYDLLNHNLK